MIVKNLSKNRKIMLVILAILIIVALGITIGYVLYDKTKDKIVNNEVKEPISNETKEFRHDETGVLLNVDKKCDNCKLNISIKNESKEIDGKKIIATYDIKLLNENGSNNKIKDSEIIISIPIENKISGYKVYDVVYLENEKIIETYNTKIENNMIIFKTSHLSEFGIIGYSKIEETENKNTNTNTTNSSTSNKNNNSSNKVNSNKNNNSSTSNKNNTTNNTTSNNSNGEYWTVTIVDGSKVRTIQVKNNDTINDLGTPTKEGHKFSYWLDTSTGKKFDFSTKITSNKELSAVYISTSTEGGSNEHCFEYKTKANRNEAIITEFTCDLETVEIPTELDGKKVTEIGDKAFYWDDNLINSSVIRNVIIPEGVTHIGQLAFYNNGITSVKLPNSLRTMGKGAFKKNKIKTVTIPEGVTVLEHDVFNNNELESIKLPESLKTISFYAFYGNQLSNVTIPKNVEAIETWSFAQNPNLTTIYNKTGRSFNWIALFANRSKEEYFVTGTVAGDTEGQIVQVVE